MFSFIYYLTSIYENIASIDIDDDDDDAELKILSVIVVCVV